jgi:hypothetical protein
MYNALPLVFNPFFKRNERRKSSILPHPLVFFLHPNSCDRAPCGGAVFGDAWLFPLAKLPHRHRIQSNPLLDDGSERVSFLSFSISFEFLTAKPRHSEESHLVDSLVSFISNSHSLKAFDIFNRHNRRAQFVSEFTHTLGY